MSIPIAKKKIDYYLGLGSNVDPQIKFIRLACQKLTTLLEVKLKLSSVYTSPALINNDPKIINRLSSTNFLNCAVSFKSTLLPLELLKIIQAVEIVLGKIPILDSKQKIWYDRTIDIDILLASSLCYNTQKLILPHYDLCNRSFVLKPLLDLKPNLRHPLTGIFLKKYLSDLESNHPHKVKITRYKLT